MAWESGIGMKVMGNEDESNERKERKRKERRAGLSTSTAGQALESRK